LSPIRPTDIFNKLQNQDILKEEDGFSDIWISNAGIQIEMGSTFAIDSKDTKWLKIVSDGESAYPTTVPGQPKDCL
jgi:hypothetical protein